MATQRHINQLGRWISLQTARPNLPWTFAVLDDPGFNAFAAPGGYVFVTKGLLGAWAAERAKRKSAPARIVFDDFAGQYRDIEQESGEK